MKIQPIKNFKFLGYHFTHKSQLLPKSMVNYYNETYSVVYPYNKTIGKVITGVQKIINRIFPDYLVETSWQKNYRRHWDTYEVDAWLNFLDKLKNGTLKDVNLTKEETQKILRGDAGIPYLRKLYDEGKLGKPLE